MANTDEFKKRAEVVGLGSEALICDEDAFGEYATSVRRQGRVCVKSERGACPSRGNLDDAVLAVSHDHRDEPQICGLSTGWGFRWDPCMRVYQGGLGPSSLQGRLAHIQYRLYLSEAIECIVS